MKPRFWLLTLVLLMSFPILSNAQNRGGGGPPGGFRGGGRPGGGNQAMTALQQRARAAQASLTGNVYLIEDDAEQAPGVGVTVIVVSPKGEGEKADTTYAVTGQNGTFTIRNLTAGNAIVTFSMLGFQEQSNPITLVPGQNRVIASLKTENIALEGAVIRAPLFL